MPHDDVRFAAQSIYQNMYRQYPPMDFCKLLHYKQFTLSLIFQFKTARSQSHSINFITEDFLAGYMEDGRRMSVVRRFFCLFVTFDLFFISLLWLICILVSWLNRYFRFELIEWIFTDHWWQYLQCTQNANHSLFNICFPFWYCNGGRMQIYGFDTFLRTFIHQSLVYHSCKLYYELNFIYDGDER